MSSIPEASAALRYDAKHESQGRLLDKRADGAVLERAEIRILGFLSVRCQTVVQDGEVRVSAKGCTFCMACAGVCPTEALSSGQGHPCLRFVEARCVQCGRCAEACPEQAVTLAPRLLFDPGSAESIRVLVAEAPFACIRCGTPFASHSMIERMTTKLEGHWMYRRPEDLRRLQMCAACRVRDLYRASGAGP